MLTALILAAGLGTRLQPLTRARAKPALPVAGRPLIEHIARSLAAQDVRDLLINLHYRPESVTSVLGDGRGLGVHVRYSWEPQVLGSAGGPRRAFGLVPDRRLLIVNGDTLAEVDIGALLAAHRRTGALATLAVVANPAPDRYGSVLVKDEDVVTGFARRGRAPARGPLAWHFIGVQVAEREAFAAVRDGEPAESVGHVFPALIRERPGSVRAFRVEAAFHDIGTPRDYLETCLALGTEALNAGSGTVIHPSARVARSVLWNDVLVGPGASLDRCVVLDGARVPQGFRGMDLVIEPDRPDPLIAGETRTAGLRVLPIASAPPGVPPGPLVT